jgi:hypothetical protein
MTTEIDEHLWLECQRWCKLQPFCDAPARRLSPKSISLRTGNRGSCLRARRRDYLRDKKPNWNLSDFHMPRPSPAA